MPLVRVDMIQGKSKDYKQTLLSCIHEGLKEAFQIEDWDRFQRIVEIPKEDFETSPNKSDSFMIIELTIFPGRSRQQKRKAIESITSNLVNRLSIEATDIFIVIHEPPLENWGMAGIQKGE